MFDQMKTRYWTTPLEELRRTGTLNTYLATRWVEAGLAPAFKSLFDMERDTLQTGLAVLRRQRTATDGLRSLCDRVCSGMRYDGLVQRLGGDLFGSATFPGEELLAEQDGLRLAYLPPDPDVPRSPASLFHVGGYLPYSDRIFRFLPEANLFLPFLRRGVPVYATALAPNGARGKLTLERFLDIVHELSDVAFHHQANAERKMIGLGYCGLAMPALAYLAARPKEADAKFQVMATMVAPIDGRRCTVFAEMMQVSPPHLIAAQMWLWERLGGLVPGDQMRTGMDIPLGSFLSKTPFGRFATGWAKPAYARLSDSAELDEAQRRELAGTYWISPENARRFPMPADIFRFFARLFTDGVDDDLRVPASYRGSQLSLKTILDETSIRLVGFYGGQDHAVAEDTAAPLALRFGDRYRHVVHPQAGHISYVLSPHIWERGRRDALDPNPIDVMFELCSQSRAQN